jgi:hypothetical protein
VAGDAHHPPAVGGQVVDPAQIPVEGVTIDAVMIAVVLDHDPIRVEDHVHPRQESAVGVIDAAAQLGFGKAGVHQGEPDERLRSGLRTRADVRQCAQGRPLAAPSVGAHPFREGLADGVRAMSRRNRRVEDQGVADRDQVRDRQHLPQVAEQGAEVDRR